MTLNIAYDKNWLVGKLGPCLLQVKQFQLSNFTGIPQYSISWFNIPKYACKEIDNINRNFFWQNNCNNNAEHYTIHSTSRDKIYRHKCQGGLGISKTEDTNVVFLAKQGWKILSQPDNIWVKVVKSKYLKTISIFLSTLRLLGLLLHLGRVF